MCHHAKDEQAKRWVPELELGMTWHLTTHAVTTNSRPKTLSPLWSLMIKESEK